MNKLLTISKVVTILFGVIFIWSWIGNDALLYRIDRALGSDDGDAFFLLGLILFGLSLIAYFVIDNKLYQKSSPKTA